MGELKAAGLREVVMAAPAWARHSKPDIVKATAIKVLAPPPLPLGFLQAAKSIQQSLHERPNNYLTLSGEIFMQGRWQAMR